MQTKGLLRGLAKKLVLDKLIDEETLLQAYEKARMANISFIHYVLQNYTIKSSSFLYSASTYFGLSILDITTFNLDYLPMEFINIEFVKKHLLLPIFRRGENLFVAVIEPEQSAINEIKFCSGLIIHCVLVDYEQLMNLINDAIQKKETAVFDHIDTANIEIPGDTIEEAKIQNVTEHIDEAPIIRLVYKIILDAVNKKASDIHFEPSEKTYRVRIRLDGMLHEISHLNLNLAHRVCARIKIMANLDITERRIPQDGRFKINFASNKNVDFRVSSCLTIYGEKIVIRILTAINSSLTIDDLGFETQQKDLFLQALQKPHGMIIVTGPTGSGKTVTLYTGMSLLNTAQVNISTVEDPVEIHLNGINQVNICNKAGLTFPIVLRALLRQDPDVIMVGEMRDHETVEIGIKAAQTGHLVLSTLHTNNAADSIIRLLSMGLPLYNIVSTIKLIIAQRLVRLLCSYCKFPTEINNISHTWSANAQGCKHCIKGYKGRTGIFEILSVNDSLIPRKLHDIHTAKLQELAVQQGMLNLYQAGLLKVSRGETSLEEIHRVITE